MNGRARGGTLALVAMAMMLGGGGMGILGMPTNNPRAKRPPPDEDRKARAPGCQCQLEEGDSPCPIHGDEALTPETRPWGDNVTGQEVEAAIYVDPIRSVRLPRSEKPTLGDLAEAKRERKRQARLRAAGK